MCTIQVNPRTMCTIQVNPRTMCTLQVNPRTMTSSIFGLCKRFNVGQIYT